MAVYTELSTEDLAELAARYGLGRVSAFRGLPEGSINTNYALQTERGRYFLRHTTVREDADLSFEAALLSHLHKEAFPAPTLHETTDGRPFVPFRGGRVSVFGWLSGEELTRSGLTGGHLQALGRELGKLHRVANSFTGHRENPYSQAVVRSWLEALSTQADAEVQAALPELFRALEAASGYDGLVPRGVIHADLFMDNVKWLGDRVSAFFDFEMACVDAWVLDLGITLDAWCFDGGAYREDLCRALLSGYQEERPLLAAEPLALYAAARFGAVRFTASRIRDFHLSQVPSDRLFQKDFRTYLARVRALDALGPDGFTRLWSG